jgi:hypothetical protein
MNVRARLANWSLPVLLLGVPLCAALALEHASVAGQKARIRSISVPTAAATASPANLPAPAKKPEEKASSSRPR